MKNLIGVWPNLFRAFEIAKTGGHSVTIYFTPEYENGTEDYQMIKTFCKDWFEKFVSDGDIKVEICLPSYFKKDNFETLEDIQKRIDKALSFPLPEFKIDMASEELLKNAVRRAGLSLKQVEIIEKVSQTIARLELSDKIEAYHVAEAIHYQLSSTDDGLINAEDDTIHFGKKITIKRGDIPESNLQAAIKYLKRI